ncbi:MULTISPECIES: hypothetical protein [Methylomonas]|uniref:Uncharacterized protein n=1 Tax=Methylomonas koyamae TaxID=702114 RepID=A0A177PJB4_9GAMM|nr:MULTISPECIES: hypothetical protein [Methylomonas]ANE58011.1 hypothetical protein AYM39_22280 [Methylomonas sp. DH-1]OAI10632.1 hypothetical protein A1507_21565 [Methylomonas koyamae]OAI30271.1 hypothetical protein A1356_22045 [Methylomonas koyamae]
MSRRDLIFLTLKSLLAWLALSCLVFYLGEWLAKGLFPLIKAVMISMAPDLSPSLKLVKSLQSQLDYSIELSAWVLQPIYLNSNHFIPPQTELKSSAHLIHSFVPLVIEGVILLAWPVQCWQQRLLLIGLGLLTAVLVVMATLPAQLLGKLEISFQDIAVAGQNPRPVPLFLDWMVFCEVGGRWLLAIVAAWLCVQLQRIFLRK